jgi:hypothetical protein
LASASVSRWYRELQHYGFIEMITAAHLGIEGKGKAARWRITDEPHHGDPPTNDFLRWDGVLFDEPENRIPNRPAVHTAPIIGSLVHRRAVHSPAKVHRPAVHKEPVKCTEERFISSSTIYPSENGGKA